MRAFGTRSSVSGYLARDGEAAIPATLDALDDDDSRIVAVALATLRLIVTPVTAAGTGELDAAALDRFRTTTAPHAELGDVMGSVSARRQTTCLRKAACWTLVLVAWGTTLVAQSFEDRLLIDNDVACRAEPHGGAPVVRRLPLGDQLLNPSRVTVDGEEWYRKNLTSRSSCWTYGPQTVEFDFRDQTAGVLALAEHALALGDAADFEHLVAVDNLLIDPRRSGLYFDTASPMLALRHLEIVERANSRIGWRSGRVLEPLESAWQRGQAASGRLQLRAAAYWELYERYADAPEAETLAWTAAAKADAFITEIDECETPCYVSQITTSTMRYWVAFPEGPHIVEVLELAAERLEYASRHCVVITARLDSAQGPNAVSVVEEYSAQIRSSLDAVTVSAKEALLTLLDELDYWCVTNGVEDLDDARTIPAFVRAWGTGLGVSRMLAGYGEAVIPATLDALDDEDPGIVTVALATLRLIVTADAGALSNDTAPAIQRAAERWLTASPQTSTTLGAAIRLASVMGNPRLLEIVETLATDATAVAARGITDARSVADLQRLAAAQLAADPPSPRP